MSNSANSAATLATPFVQSKEDFQQQFIDGALHKLASSIALRGQLDTGSPGKTHATLSEALGHILNYFGCPVDEVALSVSIRGDSREIAIRRVCEENHIHVREVQLEPHELRRFGAPILAFRGGEPVVLRPGTWRTWTEVAGGATRGQELEPCGYTFYKTLPADSVRMRDFFKLVFASDNQRELGYAIAWGLLAATLSSASVYLMASLVDWALPQGDRSGLALLATGWCVVALAASNLRLSRVLLQTRIGTRVEVSTEAALVARALSLPLSEFKTVSAGELTERIRGATQFAKVAFGTATDTILSAATLVAYSIMLATTSSRALAAVLAVLLVRAVVGGVLLTGTYADGKRQSVARGRMNSRLFELLSSIPRIKVAGAEPRAFYHWATAFASVRHAGYRTSLFSGLLTATEGFFDVAGTIVLYAVCFGGGGPTGTTVGSFVVATACLGGIQAAYSGVVSGLRMLLPMIPAANRVRPLLAASAEVHAGAASTTLEGNLSLRHVTFHYADDDVRVLDNISLDIKKGQFVAVVGPSGCGKSTLIKMFLGFYAPTSGSVLVDWKDISTLDIRSVRRQIGAVLQGSELLPSSILFNIVGTSKKTIEDAWTAAKRAAIADDIAQMPMNMHTLLSDRAVTISGGQKQRILIARALVREPKVIIFDEATSALDNKTQASVMAAIREMDATKICIAHRLSTVVHADRIIVMDKGSIVQQGTYQELIEQDGLFRTLAQTQLSSEN